MADILAKARAGRTVLKRTTQAQGFKLPSLVLYMEWLAGENKRRVIDTEGQEHRLPDKIVESSYRLVTGGQAEELLAQHWPAQLGDAAPAKAAQPRPAPRPVGWRERVDDAERRSRFSGWRARLRRAVAGKR